MRKLNYLDNISYIKINNKNIYIKSNKNIHILNKLLQEIKNKEKLNLRVSISKLSLINGQEFAILTFCIF